MRGRSAVAAFVFFAVAGALFADGEIGGSKPFRLGFPADAARPEVMVYIVFPETSIAGSLTSAEFDRMVRQGEVDRIIAVPFGSTLGAEPKRLGQQLSEVSFHKAQPSELRTIDIRYRIDFLDGARVLRSVHATSFGHVLQSGQLWLADQGGDWLRSLMKTLTSDLVLPPPPSK